MRVMEFGGPEVVVAQTAPDPVAGPGQVVIGVSVAEVLLLDALIRSGGAGEYFTVEPPYVPGAGVAGVVISVGAEVDPGWLGHRVLAETGESGGYVEKLAVAQEGLIPVPAGLDQREAAALLHDGRTALGLADDARIRPGESVLITGASGGLGILLVQLAHAGGARVIGTARGKRKLDLVRELGADHVVDHSEPGRPEQTRVATGGTGAEVVFDGIGGETGRAAFKVMARGGRFSAHGAPSGHFAVIDPHEARRRGVRMRGIEQVQFTPEEGKLLTERALDGAAAGRFRPIIGQTFPLERAADAHAAMEARSVLGKTLLVL